MIHLNIGSNLNSKFGSRIDNICTAIKLLIEGNVKIIKISSFYETPSYPNRTLSKFLNIGILADFKESPNKLFDKVKLIEGDIKNTKQFAFCEKLSEIFDFTVLDNNELNEKVDLIFASEYFEHVSYIILNTTWNKSFFLACSLLLGRCA